MQRFTISLSDALAHEFDALIDQRGYTNRSEAVRDILLSHLGAQREAAEASGPCVANLSFVYDHHERELSERLAKLQHAQHHLTIATTHVHLDAARCLETIMLKGAAQQVRQFANRLMAERGVHHGQLNLVMVGQASDADAPQHHPHGHAHERGNGHADDSAHAHSHEHGAHGHGAHASRGKGA